MTADQETFETLYVSFQPKIQRYLARLLGEKEAEDLAQEVFIKLEKDFTNFRGEAQLSTWVYRIATNAAIDRMRSFSFKNKTVAYEEAENIAADRVDLPLEDQIIHREMNACIRAVIDKLPDNYRLIVILSDLEGLPTKEIASILDLDVTLVKTRLHRGRLKLKSELECRCTFSWDERNEFACDPKPGK